MRSCAPIAIHEPRSHDADRAMSKSRRISATIRDKAVSSRPEGFSPPMMPLMRGVVSDARELDAISFTGDRRRSRSVTDKERALRVFPLSLCASLSLSLSLSLAVRVFRHCVPLFSRNGKAGRYRVRHRVAHVLFPARRMIRARFSTEFPSVSTDRPIDCWRASASCTSSTAPYASTRNTDEDRQLTLYALGRPEMESPTCIRASAHERIARDCLSSLAVPPGPRLACERAGGRAGGRTGGTDGRAGGSVTREPKNRKREREGRNEESAPANAEREDRSGNRRGQERPVREGSGDASPREEERERGGKKGGRAAH